MRVSTVLTLLLGAASAVALAQDPSQSSRNPQTGGMHSTSSSTTTNQSSSIVTGHVVRYEPGREIVVRDQNNRERTFTLGAGVTLPVDIHVGSFVELSTESNGTNVTRVRSATESGTSGTSGTSGSTYGTGSTSGGAAWGTTSGSSSTLPNTGTTGTSGAQGATGSMTPSQSNQDSSSTQKSPSSTTGTYGGSSRLPNTGTSGNMNGSTGKWVTGTVTAYTPGQSVTISLPGGATVEYKVDSSTFLPGDLAVGKQVSVQSDTGMSGTERTARRITYAKSSTGKSSGSSSPR